MGKLAEYLQDSFVDRCLDGWKCEREVQILDARLAKLFGYAPQADVVQERIDGTRAWRHLHEHLGMTLHELDGERRLTEAFDGWIQTMPDAIQLNGKGVKVLVPPVWFQ